MKGVDIVVARLGRAHGRVHGAERPARRLRRRGRRARRLDLRGAPLRARHASPASAPTASRRSCAPSTSPSCASCSSAAGDRTPTRRASAATARRAGSTTSTSTTRGVLAMTDDRSIAHRRRVGPARVRDLRPPRDRTRSSAPRATGIYDIRGCGAKRRVPHFDDLLLLGASVSRYPLEGYRERCDTDVVLGTRFAKQPLHARHPDHDRRHELRRAVGANAKEALGRGATARRAPARRPATAA